MTDDERYTLGALVYNVERLQAAMRCWIRTDKIPDLTSQQLDYVNAAAAKAANEAVPGWKGEPSE